MTSRLSTIATNVVTEVRGSLRFGQVQLLAWLSPVETRKRLCLLQVSGAPLHQSDLCHARDYVSARAEARSNSNVDQGHAGSVAFYRLRFTAVPRRATAGYDAGTVAPPSTATPNPSIEGMPKRLRLLCTPHVKR
jgi:hypothetical protein